MESILEQRLRTGATIHSSLLHAVKSHAWGGVWRVVQCSFYSPFALPYPFSSFLCPDLNPFRFHHPSSLTICLPVGFGQRKVPGRDLRAGGERDRSNICYLGKRCSVDLIRFRGLINSTKCTAGQGAISKVSRNISRGSVSYPFLLSTY